MYLFVLSYLLWESSFLFLSTPLSETAVSAAAAWIIQHLLPVWISKPLYTQFQELLYPPNKHREKLKYDYINTFRNKIFLHEN